MKNRDELIKEYYLYSPRDCIDLIDLDKEKERIENMPLDELQKEVEFYKETFGWD